MKDLIIAGLDSAFDQLIKQTPKTKKITKSISIYDVKPIDLPQFMLDNNIPADAYFDGKDNGYDGWDDILLSWDINIPVSDDDKLKYYRSLFPSIASKKVSKILNDNGYGKTPMPSGHLEQFKDLIPNIYDAYANKNFDVLVSYYSAFFKFGSKNPYHI